MGKSFTELLTDFLDAQRTVDYERDKFTGEDFYFHFANDIERRDNARDALNKAFEELRNT